ncbi:hypothetical protein PROFUN_02368 [Planoprotostelium fungivorum]|uniref:Transmembrane protein n=1 Tax=Planoprotostelium fungivorum TaxID=1890364 RepID=A0A2P6NUX6_9EUKA|nr:hypothetical protein PROFUN_02368 [Planoprotostelium fungivorum]
MALDSHLRLKTDSPARKIDLETYERQKEAFTRQQVGLLADTIRRNPKVAKDAAHFQTQHLEAVKREVFLRFAILGAFGVYLIYLARIVSFPFTHEDVQYHEFSLHLHQRLPEFLCESNSFTRFLNQLPTVFGFASFIFIILVLKQYLKNKSIETRVSVAEQSLKIVVDNLFPLSIICVLTLASLFTFTHTTEYDAQGKAHRCVHLPTNEIESTLLPSLRNFFSGVYSLVLKQLVSHPRFTPDVFNHTWILFGTIASLYAVWLQIYSLIHYKNQNHWLATVLFGLSICYIQLNGWHTVVAGEFLAISFVFTRAISAGVRYLMLERSQRKYVKTSQEHRRVTIEPNSEDEAIDEDDDNGY